MIHSLALIVEVETTSYDCLTVEKVIDLINNPQDEDDSDYANILATVYGTEQQIKAACFEAFKQAERPIFLIRTFSAVELVEPTFNVEL